MAKLITLEFGATSKQEKQQREDQGMGKLRDQLKAWSKANNVKKPNISTVGPKNIANYGKQLLIKFVGIDKETGEPVETEKGQNIFVGKALSDEFRDGDCLFSAFLDFTVEMHTNKDNDGNILPDKEGNAVTYPIIKRPEMADEGDDVTADVNDKAASYVRTDVGSLMSILRAQGMSV
jgi:hypothetical protein